MEVYGGGILKTSQEHFTDLVQDPMERATAVPTGAEVVSGGSTSPEGPSLSASTDSAPTTPATPGFGPNLGVQGTYSQYFGSLGEGAQKLGGQLQGAESTFYTGAGARRSYDQTAMENILRSAITRGGDDEKEFTEAQKLAGAQYTGPGGLDQATVDQILQSITPLEDRARALRGPAGYQALVGEVNPQLTAGQRRYEANRLRQRPQFLEEAQSARSAVENLSNRFAGSRTAASDYAAGRAAEEADIREQSRGFLAGREAPVEEEINRNLAAAQAEDARNIAAYNAILESGNLADLLDIGAAGERPRTGPWIEGGDSNPPLPNIPGVGFSVQNLINELPEIGKIKRGEAVRQSIMDRYGDIKDVPLLVAGINAHGRKRLEIPQEWWDANKGNYSTEEIIRIRDTARRRQEELETALGREGVLDLMPIELSEAFTPERINDPQYLSRNVAEGLTREGVASEDQRHTLNTIRELLGRSDLLGEETYKPGEININVEALLGRERERLSKHKQDVAADILAFEQEKRHQRKKYKRQKSKGGPMGPLNWP